MRLVRLALSRAGTLNVWVSGNLWLVMPTAEKYRDLAKECLRSAFKAKTSEEATAFFDMARTWMQAATQGERQSPPIVPGGGTSTVLTK
jgi:hypothetical protein